jgi:hypothetical protein
VVLRSTGEDSTLYIYDSFIPIMKEIVMEEKREEERGPGRRRREG